MREDDYQEASYFKQKTVNQERDWSKNIKKRTLIKDTTTQPLNQNQ